MTTNFSQTAAYIWSLADLLRGDFKQSQYGRVILPFTILRRLECVLEASKPAVLAQAEKLKVMPNVEAAARDKLLLRAAGLSFYNTSPMDLAKLGSADIKSNLTNYVDNFSTDAREIFEHFKFADFVAQLNEANLLFKVVQRVAATDLSPEAISNHDMGLVFEELIRRFAESSNETAGEHFTPRDIVRLTTALVFMEDDDALTEEGIIRTIYDPTAGTGGFLSSGMEYVHELNPRAVMRAFGQELNPESYAICKGDMLIKGQDVSRIKLGNTLSDDQLANDRFDYMLSNPPFGVDWKKVEGEIKSEHTVKGFDGRFGPGLPRVSDGSLLFLLHLLSKLRDYDPNAARGEQGKNGGRIGIILNGSPLFTGGAGSGESEIRRHILESDLLEAIIALPTDMFYHTGIPTYIWILSNKKPSSRKGKVQLINGVHLYQKMRKGLGFKRQELGEEDIALITHTFSQFEAVKSYNLDNIVSQDEVIVSDNTIMPITKNMNEGRIFAAKIFANHEFGYRRITIERPQRRSVQFTDERLTQLRFASDLLSKDPRKPDLDIEQRPLFDKAKALQQMIGTDKYDDFNAFDTLLTKTLKQTGIKLGTTEKKQLLDAVSWINPSAEPIIKKVLKKPANPLYGAFSYRGKVVEFRADTNLRDSEDVPLTAATARGKNVDAVNEAYFTQEVAPYVADAWIDISKRDGRDGQVGIVGYKVPFVRLFTDFASLKDRQERIKLKTLLSRSAEGKYIWHPTRKRFSLAIEEPDTIGGVYSSRYSERVDVDEQQLNVDYLNLFFASPESDDWIQYATVSDRNHANLPISRLLECEIQLPDIRTQGFIVHLSDEHNSLSQRIDSIRSSLFSDPVRADLDIQRYHNAGNRFEEEFTHQLPHPLSVLWVQAQFAIEDKNRCEDFIKFYEYLGLFVVSVILGQLSEEDTKNILKKKAKYPDKPYITMGTAYNLINYVRDAFGPQIRPQFKPFISEDWANLLKDATRIRNEIAHRGIHAKASVRSWKSQIDSLNEKFTILSRTLFEQIILVRPKHSTYIRSLGSTGIFRNTVDLLRGLALNPSIAIKISTSEPMLDGELYIVTGEISEPQMPHRIFPLMKLLDTDDENGIAAFYFYNQWDGESEKYIYVCPYPSAAHQKRLDNSTLFPMMTNND